MKILLVVTAVVAQVDGKAVTVRQVKFNFLILAFRMIKNNIYIM